MKAWGRGVCLGACAALALLAMASAASAKPGYYVSHASRATFLQAKGSNGYSITVVSFNARHLLLAASRPSGSASYYVTRRASRSGELKASFGKLGEISMRFEPDGPPKAQPQPGSECVGKKPTQEWGHFVGILRFRSEGGFTTVRSTNIKGEVLRSFRQVCKRPHEPHAGGKAEPRAVSLTAYVKGDPRAPSFNAYELTRNSPLGSPGASYSASITEKQGGIVITRSANASAEPSTFVVSDPAARPIVASVTPPFPFSGTATFESVGGRAPTWSGNLSASFPGLESVPLTGSPYAARLCRDLSCACPPEAACVVVFGTSGRVESALRLLGNPARPAREFGPWRSAP